MTRTTRRRAAVAAAALAVTLTLTACADGTQDEPAGDPGTADQLDPAEEAPAEHNAADTEFAQMMIVHHEGALEMSELALERAETDEVRDLAQRIADAQGPEIELMSGWLDAWGAEQPADMDHGGMDHAGMDMEGMSQDEAMGELGGLSGTEFDRRFLELMIAHHRGAVEMSGVQISAGSDPQAVALAGEIIDAQEAEIAEMEDMLGRL